MEIEKQVACSKGAVVALNDSLTILHLFGPSEDGLYLSTIGNGFTLPQSAPL